MLKHFEELALQIADTDRDWWPFLFLRPQPHERMTSSRLLLLSALYGAMFGVLANVLLAAIGEPMPLGSFFAVPLQIATGLFLAFRFTVAIAWNQRAATYAKKARFDHR